MKTPLTHHFTEIRSVMLMALICLGCPCLLLTQHVHGQTDTIMNAVAKNRLQFEKSPYLLQHADNPVDWYPWGEEAFEKARETDKPIFLSIGYSTCHWCHVMEHESFEDAEVADLLNEVFVSIKVDREERPDIDSVYMTVSQMMTGSGGWPLTILMTPDKKPFFAGTYIPKDSRFGRVGLLQLIPRVQELWKTERGKLLDSADQILQGLQSTSTAAARPDASEAEELDQTALHAAYQQLEQNFDAQHGGFGSAPKFPTPHTLLFLLRWWQRSGDEQALTMVERTLQAMRLGGVYDHIGYGFHRYSTDAEWLLPHFEKMLYDQALIALAYLETYQATHNDFYADVTQEIFSYVLRDMTAPSGGFYSAEDADSEGEEGKFYVWSAAEIRNVLSTEEATLFLKIYNFEENGNFREQSTGETTGDNIVFLRQPPGQLAADAGMSEQQLRDALAGIRQKLFDIREQRVHPHKDDKILVDWNGLMIAALAKGAQVLNEPRYAEAAERSAQFILHTMRDENGRLLHRYRDGNAAVQAYLDDYAFLIWGLLELYETTFDIAYLEQALTLQQDLDARFWDDASVALLSRKQRGGYFFTADNTDNVLVRQKQVYDGAVPAGNSVAMLNLVRLGRLTANTSFEAKAARLSQIFSHTIRQAPSAYTFFLLGADFGLGPSHEVVIIGDVHADDTQRLLQALRREFLPNNVVVVRSVNEVSAGLLNLVPYVEPYVSIDGKSATVYVCRNYICNLPTTDVKVMLDAFRLQE